MMNLFFGGILSFFISFVLIFICYIISKKSIVDREKSSPFECGFDPKGSSRIPFSIRFFLIAIVFLIFDIEIVLLLPLPLSLSISEYYHVYVIGVLFLLILLFGLFYEWMDGALEWAK